MGSRVFAGAGLDLSFEPWLRQIFLDTAVEYGDISPSSTPQSKKIALRLCSRYSLPALSGLANSLDTPESGLAILELLAHACAYGR